MKVEWNGFAEGNWSDSIDVAEFIKLNYTCYDGDASFLAGPTKRTEQLMVEVNTLLLKEQENNGVLGIDTEKVTSILSYKPGYIDKDKEIIVGLQTEAPLVRGVNPFGGMRMAIKSCEGYGMNLSKDVINQFKYRTTHNEGVFMAYNGTMRKARHAGIITGLPDAYGRGRLIGDYRRIALYGMDFLITCKKADKEEFGDRTMTEENIRIVEELSKQIGFMEQLKTLASWYGCDISRPAANAVEAVQWLYFGYLGSVKEQNGAANSIGRISTFLDIYFERDIQAGVMDESRAQEIMDDFIIKLRLVRHLRTEEYNDLFAGDPVWVTMSEAGCTAEGKSLVTKNSFRTLQTLYNLGSSCEPNITILWSQTLPQGYKDFCAQVSIDTDSIQYENDDIMRSRFTADYSIACCVSAMGTGKQMQFFGARCNMAKVLLMALNGGKDEVYGEQVAPLGDIFDADGALDYDKVMAAYDTYSEWIAALYVNTLNIIHFMHDKYAYERLTMAFHDTDPGRLMAFGISGLSVLADSLSAIKYAKVTPIKDERGLITDFTIEGEFPRFGNDDDRVDMIAKFITDDFYKKLVKTPCYRNAVHTLSILTITSNVVYGRKTGNTPDGRRAKEPFAPGGNPMHGRDINGAVASLSSVAKLDYDSCRDGISNTFSVTPHALGENKTAQVANLTSMLDGYFAQNAHHLNVNVFNRELLVDAMENPGKYPTLTVRVSGYAVNFNRLTRDKQEEVISRTFHETL